jgi:hypothetical protein
VRTKPLLIVSLALALVAGACSNSPTETSAPSTASRSPSGPGSASTSTGPSASDSSGGVSASANTSTTAPTASTPTCTPETPTALSANWAPLQAHDGDFSFKFPANWDKLYGAFVFNTNSLLDAQTFAETGLPSTSTTRADLVRTPGSGLPNASVLIVPGVVSNTATVFSRQVERFKAIADIKVIATNLVSCIGGDQALGISFTFNKDTTYQESWYVVRNGRSYDAQWLAPKGQEQTETFKEIARTWAWTANVPVATPLPPSSSRPSVAPSISAGASSFVLAGMATKVDPAATAANPKDFVTTIPKESTSMYAVFSLKTGLTGQVNGALKQGDRVLVTLSLTYGPKHTWGNFRINSANGITPGNYTMVITYAPSGETINLPFVVK